MQESSDRLIDNYIQRITEFSQNFQRIPTSEELDKIVSELGITAEQIAATQTASQSHFIRAKSYTKLKQWDDAILELEEGISLNPFSLEMISCLGEAYMGRWNLKHQREDAINIQKTAKKCLQIKPDAEAAMSLLFRFHRSSRWRKNSQIALGVILISLTTAGVSVSLMPDLLKSIILSNPFSASLLNQKITLNSLEKNIISLEDKQSILNEKVNSVIKENISSLESKQLTLQEEVNSLKNEQSTLKSELTILRKKLEKPTDEKLIPPSSNPD